MGQPVVIRIALFRGINVGGRNKLPMAELRKLMVDQGYLDVRTYIQSGNVVFRTAPKADEDLADAIAAAVEHEFSFRPPVIVLSTETLQQAMVENPFPEAEQTPNRLHYYFCDQLPETADEEKLKRLAASAEQWALRGRVLYLFAPDGIGRSRLAANAEKCLGVPTTARNHRTVEAVYSLAVK